MTKESKILPLEELASVIESLKGEGKTVVHCHGVFDLLHPGHFKHFASAKKEGDVLVVTITPDEYVNKGPGRPAFATQLRVEQLAALADIDYVAINKWPTAVETIALLKPNVYAKGPDYKDQSRDISGKISDEEEAINNAGGRMHITDDATFSSSGLLNNHFEVFSGATKEFLQDFKKQYTAEDVTKKLDDLKGLKVLIVGDTIIDEYHSCSAIGMASKSTSINARFMSEESYLGGALAIANHVAGLCDTVHLVSVLGSQDSKQEMITAGLKKNVAAEFLLRDDGPTTVKRRYVDPFRYQKMFEVTFMEDSPLPESVASQLNETLKKQIKDYDLVIVSDFGHGMIGKSTIDLLTKQAKYLALNVQTNSSNIGYNPVTKFPGADYACIDERELRIAYHDRCGDAEELTRRVADDLSVRLLTVTQGTKGSVTYEPGGKLIQTPVFCSEVIDTVGAGDAYFSISAPAAASGFDPALVGFLGNVAGAIATRIVGNKESVDPVTLKKFVTTLLK